MAGRFRFRISFKQWAVDKPELDVWAEELAGELYGSDVGEQNDRGDGGSDKSEGQNDDNLLNDMIDDHDQVEAELAICKEEMARAAKASRSVDPGDLYAGIGSIRAGRSKAGCDDDALLATDVHSPSMATAMA